MKKTVSIVLSLVMLLSAFVMPAAVSAEDVTEPQSAVIEFGSYPQTEVTDADLKTALNGITAEWVSYGYYVEDYSSNFMKYKDVVYDGEKYRGVTFSSYRPFYTEDGSSAANSNQDDNGYERNVTYWFKYEPLKWIALNAEEGLFICESIVDSLQFYHDAYSGTAYRRGDTSYSNCYKHSDVRSFLAGDFYDLAFTAEEKEMLIPTTVNGRGSNTQYSDGNGDVTDSVFLLSEGDVPDGDAEFKIARGTDYAKCQGLWVYEGNSNWWLRTCGSSDYYADYVNNHGEISCTSVCYSDLGVRPAVKINLESSPLGCAVGRHTAGTETLYKAPSCSEAGYRGYVCAFCGAEVITQNLAKESHRFRNGFCEYCGKLQLQQYQIVNIGSYPQSEVTDETLIAALNGISADWISYGYYYTEDQPSDAMKYKDVEYNGDRYRAVTFSKYRLRFPDAENDAAHTYQDDYGYNLNTAYWFKFEPLQWRVLDAEEGLLMCESLIDAQPFHHKYYFNTLWRGGENAYANSYRHSDIRVFLTEDFYNLAFTEAEKDALVPTTVKSNDYSANCGEGNSKVTDSVFLLSYSDVVNPSYGFNSTDDNYDPARFARGTDYAKCQGLACYSSQEYSEFSDWWLRSADSTSLSACYVKYYGNASLHNTVSQACVGIRPAITLNMQERSSYCVINGRHTEDEGAVTTAPNCTESGVKSYSCAVCGEFIRTETVEPLGHEYEDGVCAVCGINSCGFYQGDADCDGEITAADVSLIRLVFAGNASRDLLLDNVDLNRDGVINAKDLLILRKLLAS